MHTMEDYQYNNYDFGDHQRITSLFRKLNQFDDVPAYWIVNVPFTTRIP